MSKIRKAHQRIGVNIDKSSELPDACPVVNKEDYKVYDPESGLKSKKYGKESPFGNNGKSQNSFLQFYAMPILGFVRLAVALGLALFISREQTSHDMDGKEVDILFEGIKDPIPSKYNPSIPSYIRPPLWLIESLQRTMICVLLAFFMSSITITDRLETFRKLIPPNERKSTLTGKHLIGNAMFRALPMSLSFLAMIMFLDLLAVKGNDGRHFGLLLYVPIILSVVPFLLRLMSHKRIRKYYCKIRFIVCWIVALMTVFAILLESEISLRSLSLIICSIVSTLVFIKGLNYTRETLGPEALLFTTNFKSTLLKTNVKIVIMPLVHAMLFSCMTILSIALPLIRITFFYGNMTFLSEEWMSVQYVKSSILFLVMISARAYGLFFFMNQMCYLTDQSPFIALINQLSIIFFGISIANWIFTSFWFNIDLWESFSQLKIIYGLIIITNFLVNNSERGNKRIFKARETKTESSLNSLPEMIRVALALPFWLLGSLCCKIASLISPRQVKFLVFEVADLPNVVHGVSYNLVATPDVEPGIFYVNVGYLENHTQNDKWLHDARDTSSTTLDILEEFSHDPEHCRKIGLVGSVINEYIIPANVSASGKQEIKQFNLSAWTTAEAAHEWARGNEPHNGIVRRYHGQGLNTFGAMISGWKPSTKIKYHVRCRKCKRMIYNYPTVTTCKYCNRRVPRMNLF